MKRAMTLVILSIFALTWGIPTASANSKAWLTATKDKEVRGIENGLFGMGGELYHSIHTRSQKSVLDGWTKGLGEGAFLGLKRTLVGVYEIVTPFYHDQPILSDFDSLTKS